MTSKKVLIALWGVFAWLWLGLAHGYLENSDSIVTMHAARSWWRTGDPGIAIDQPDLTQAERTALAVSQQLMKGRNGKYYAQFAIGHQALMVPCIALAEACERRWPWLLARHRELVGDDPVWSGHPWERLFCSLLPIPFAALVALAVFLLARTLGCATREALLVVVVTVLATQFGPGATETMSDVPGLALLCCVALFAARFERGAGNGAAFAVGLFGGMTVLVRYPNALPVAAFGALVAVLALVRGRYAALLALASGALPGCVLLLVANWSRFGSIREFGYSGGANAGWWDMPWRWGIPLVLLAPGKGILLFSPPLWTTFLAGMRGAGRFGLAVLVAAVLPVLLVAHTRGWSGAQCWSIRYLTPTVVLLVALGLATGKPWRTWPRAFAATTALGLALFLAGNLAPYRGHQQLAAAAAQVAYAGELASGRTTLGALSDQYFVDPHFSPLFGHFVYAGAAVGDGLVRERLPATTRVMFAGHAVPSDTPALLREDTGFRHLLPFQLADLLGVSALWFVLPWLAILAASVRTLCTITREPRASTQSSVA